MGKPKKKDTGKPSGDRSVKTKGSSSKRKDSFIEAVAKCSEIKNNLNPGLSALRKHSIDVKVSDTKLLKGSVDIDKAVASLRPNDARWDFVVGYDEEAYFIEIHPAGTSNVSEMLKKVDWLKMWLNTVAPDLKKLHKTDIYYWVPSGSVNILPGSVQQKRIAASHLRIIKPVILPPSSP